MIFFTTVTTVKKILSSFGNSNLTHLTIGVMFSGQCFATVAIFFWRGCVTFLFRGCMIFFEVWFLCGEVAWCFCVERLREFLTPSQVCLIFFVERLPDFFVEVAWFFLVWRYAWFFLKVVFCLWSGCVIFVCRGCVSFCEERLRQFLWGEVACCFWLERLYYFSHSLTHEVV